LDCDLDVNRITIGWSDEYTSKEDKKLKMCADHIAGLSICFATVFKVFICFIFLISMV
jgi:hypothetical protein